MAQSHGVVRGNRRGGNSGHREKRDANTAINRELKQENQSLKKQVARLKKTLSQTEANAIEVCDTLEFVEPEDFSVAKCPKCKAVDTLVEIKTPTKTITRCRDCKATI